MCTRSYKHTLHTHVHIGTQYIDLKLNVNYLLYLVEYNRDDR